MIVPHRSAKFLVAHRKRTQDYWQRSRSRWDFLPRNQDLCSWADSQKFISFPHIDYWYSCKVWPTSRNSQGVFVENCLSQVRWCWRLIVAFQNSSWGFADGSSRTEGGQRLKGTIRWWRSIPCSLEPDWGRGLNCWTWPCQWCFQTFNLSLI